MIKILFNVIAVYCISVIIIDQTRGNNVLNKENFVQNLDSLNEVSAGLKISDEWQDQLECQNARIGYIELKIKMLDSVITFCIDDMSDKLEQQIKQNRNFSRASKKLMLEQDSIKNGIGVLDKRIEGIKKAQSDDRTSFQNDINETNDHITDKFGRMNSHVIWGGVLLVLVIFVFGTYLYVRHIRDYISIDKIRKTQAVLQDTQIKMQEESVKLDNKMLALCEKQMASASAASKETAIDHSLALKVADEIVRIEMNLSHMDDSIKGYKQLAKAVQRIKDNFNANGYEIVDMLGRSYVSGMKAAVSFVTDENLEKGQQIITKIIKPQINYQQQMIQAAQIEVSQAE